MNRPQIGCQIVMRRASILMRPLEDGEIAGLLCTKTSPDISGTPVLSRPLKDAEITIRCSTIASFNVPGTPLLSRLLKDGKIDIMCSSQTSITVPGTPLLSRLLKDGKIDIMCSSQTSITVPGTPIPALSWSRRPTFENNKMLRSWQWQRGPKLRGRQIKTRKRKIVSDCFNAIKISKWLWDPNMWPKDRISSQASRKMYALN